MKGWWCLLKRLDINVRDVPELVAACCTLHNICKVRTDTFDEERLQGNKTTGEIVTYDTASQSGSGENIFDKHL